MLDGAMHQCICFVHADSNNTCVISHYVVERNTISFTNFHEMYRVNKFEIAFMNFSAGLIVQKDLDLWA
jgi:hypothetical protein